jgi:hypothetical protein
VTVMAPMPPRRSSRAANRTGAFRDRVGSEIIDLDIVCLLASVDVVCRQTIDKRIALVRIARGEIGDRSPAVRIK